MATISEWIRDFKRLRRWEKVSIIVGILGLLAGILLSGNHLLKINSGSNQINIQNSPLRNSPIIQNSSNVSVDYKIEEHPYPIPSVKTFIANGAQQNFTLDKAFVRDSTRVYWNGVLQVINYSYIENVATKSINFSGIPEAGGHITIEYVEI